MQNKALISALIKTVSLFLILLALIFGYLASSFGWFAKNDDVNANGNIITAEGVKVEITQVDSVGGVVNNENLSINFSGLFPGDTVSSIVEITCYREVESLSIILSAPQGCETPVISGEKKYYFGSQILLSSVSLNGNVLNINAVGKSLLSNTPESDWGTTENKIPTDIEIYTFSSLNIGTYTIKLDFTFYNASYSQNVLKNFGLQDGQICYRLFQIK